MGEARLGFDVPAGFADASFAGSPRLQELAESLTSASNRILVFALSDADLRRFMAGDAPELRRYMLAVTPRSLEHARTSADTFAAYAGDAVRSLGSAPAETDFMKYLEARTPGEMSLLAELRRDAEVVSVLQGARVPSSGGALVDFFKAPQFVLSTTTFVLLRGKTLSMTVFTAYETPADLEWIRFTTLRWIDDLRRLNAR